MSPRPLDTRPPYYTGLWAGLEQGRGWTSLWVRVGVYRLGHLAGDATLVVPFTMLVHLKRQEENTLEHV